MKNCLVGTRLVLDDDIISAVKFFWTAQNQQKCVKMEGDHREEKKTKKAATQLSEILLCKA